MCIALDTGGRFVKVGGLLFLSGFIFFIMYLVTFSLPPRTRTLKMLGAAQIFLHFSPASVNGDSGDLGPIKSRLCRFTSNRLIKPWTWDTGLLLMLRGLNSVKVTWARFDSS